jgi:hypothetical protein
VLAALDELDLHCIIPLLEAQGLEPTVENIQHFCCETRKIGAVIIVIMKKDKDIER